jgi:hypothetical protein
LRERAVQSQKQPGEQPEQTPLCITQCTAGRYPNTLVNAK